MEVRENQESLAYELLRDYKKQTKRWFIAWIVTFLVCLSSFGYMIWLLNDFGTSEEIIEVQDVEEIDNSTIKIGDDEWVGYD